MEGGVVGVVELHGHRRGILTFQSVIYKAAFKPSFFFFFVSCLLEKGYVHMLNY